MLSWLKPLELAAVFLTDDWEEDFKRQNVFARDSEQTRPNFPRDFPTATF
jgi:hypothetical protein